MTLTIGRWWGHDARLGRHPHCIRYHFWQRLIDSDWRCSSETTSEMRVRDHRFIGMAVAAKYEEPSNQ